MSNTYNGQDRLDERSASDREIVRLFTGIQNNDSGAFEAFHNLMAPRILAYSLSFTRDIDAAHDLLQTIMMQFYEHRARFVEGNLMAWLFTIARNTCRSWQVKSKRFEPLPDGFDMTSNDMPVLDDDEVSIIQRAILSLPDEFRSVVVLHYFGDMGVAEIAEAEEISISLVKMRLFRARKKLAVILKSNLDLQHGQSR
jgi:RNA polymerase sigma-70 factor (ECF subfamily)